MDISIKIITSANKGDINIKNEPFEIKGKVIPSLNEGKWSYDFLNYKKVKKMTFPDEDYDYDAMKDEYIFIGAYDASSCVGLAILKKGFFSYMYLEDLKVNSSYRHNHIGTMLMEKCLKVAYSNSYKGIYTICQDNNLNAFLFYIKTGFRIGGFDNEVYKGTSQEDKADIILYNDIAK